MIELALLCAFCHRQLNEIIGRLSVVGKRYAYLDILILILLLVVGPVLVE